VEVEVSKCCCFWRTVSRAVEEVEVSKSWFSQGLLWEQSRKWKCRSG